MALPLEGVTVLDLTRILAGPFATMRLADLGAEVIKVEPPQGDDTRKWGPPFVDGVATYFLSINRNKKSVAVNLKTDEGKEELRTLLERADVVIENFRPGTLEKLGFSYEVMKEITPDIIYCSISGFGHESPLRDKASYDVIVQGISGVQSLTGFPDGPPTRFGLSIADMNAGLHAVEGILAALYRRKNTGEGAQIDISLLDCMLSLLTYHGQIYFATGKIPFRKGNEHPSIVPYATFKASDGYFNLGVANDKFWKLFCQVMEKPEWEEDSRFATNADRVENREALTELIEGLFAQKTVAHWLELFEGVGIPVGEVYGVDKILRDSALDERDLIRPVQLESGPLDMVGCPVRFSGEEYPPLSAPPGLDEHRDELLSPEESPREDHS